MALFWYGARGAGGRLHRGLIRAPEAHEASRVLRARELAPYSVKPILATPLSLAGPALRQSPKDLSLAVRQLAALLSSGVPVVPALTALADRQRNATLRAAFKGIAEDVAAGQELSGALQARAALVGRLLPAVCRAGEVAGSLSDLLRLASVHILMRHRLRRRVSTALIYPMFVLTAVVVAVVVFSTQVLPTFEQVFDEADHPLPPMTKAVLRAGSFLQGGWPILIAVLAVLSSGLVAVGAHNRQRWESFLGNLTLRVPLWSGVERNAAMAHFTRTLGTLVFSGAPLVQAVELSAQATTNAAIREQLMGIRVALASGGNLSDLLSTLPGVDPYVVETVETGQRTGNLGPLLLQAADFYAEEAEFALQALTAFLEPMLIAAVAGLVTFVAFSMYLPLFDLVRTARVG